MEYPISLYYDTEVSDVQTIDLCRGDNDYRKVYIVDNGQRKLVIKYLSNTFSDNNRISGWFQTMEAYRKIGLYCPSIVPNIAGELLHCDTVDGRKYYTYAEEFSIYKTAEQFEKNSYKDEQGRNCFTQDVMRSLGKIAAARLDFLDWPSSYCLLEPFCAPDTTDEQTECALEFVKYIEENLPHHLPRAKMLLDMYYKCQEELAKIYGTLPTSCFQGDLNESNILLDENKKFVGLIDFNLCGKEPVLNYAVREALWWAYDDRLYGEKDSCLYLYSKELDDLRIELFLENIGYVRENYEFSALEREAFPILFRYMNSFWWHHLSELKLLKDDNERIIKLFDWLEHQMTRDDIRLP